MIINIVMTPVNLALLLYIINIELHIAIHHLILLRGALAYKYLSRFPVTESEESLLFGPSLDDV
jgi:hypothetical protein